MPYRTSAKRPSETIDIRPQPALPRLATLLGAAVLIGPGIVAVWAAFDHGIFTADALWPAVGVLLGLVFLRDFLRSASVVRLVFDESDVSITWLRGRRTLRVERLKRDDLVDVAIDDAPASGGTVHRLALGTTLGDIVFNDCHTGDLAFYRRRAHELHRALGVPLRG